MGRTPEDSNTSSRWFILKIAFFNAFMFFLVIWCDCRMFALKPAGLITEPPCFDCWALVWTTTVFIGNCILLSCTRHIHRMTGPLLLTSGCGLLVSILYFKWPQQHMHQVVGFSLYPIPGLIATHVHSVPPLELALIHDLHIPFAARLERVKQATAFWMALTVSGGAAYLAFVYFWLNYMSSLAAAGLSDRSHQVEVRGLYAVQIGTFSVYFVLGPIYEGFAKVRSANRLLLDLRDRASDHRNGSSPERDS